MNEKQKKWTDFVSRYQTDREFAQSVQKDPRKSLCELGAKIPDGVKVDLHQNTEKVFHLVIPLRMEDISFRELSQTSGGSSGAMSSGGGGGGCEDNCVGGPGG